MKKLVSIMLLAVLVLAFQLTAQAEAVEIGIVQMADNGAFTDMREGFIARLRELGYGEDKLSIDYRNAQGDMATLSSICQAMVENGVDIVVTIATPPTQAMVAMESGIPVFFISVGNPVGAGVITDMAKPDKLATGTSNAIPIGEIFNLADSLTPGKRFFGILYNTGEVNSATTAGNAKTYLEENGYSVEEAIVTASSEVQQAAQALIDKGVEAIFVPNDAMVQSAMPLVAEIAREAGVPVYGSSAVMVASGAFATIAIDDPTIGAITADMVDRYLNGTAVEDIPAVVVDQFTTVINRATADKIGVELSQDVLNTAVILGE